MTPISSLNDGLAETRHVFLAGNALPARFRPGFHIAELGFGTGLNMLAALIAWRARACRSAALHHRSRPIRLPAPDIARALAHFPEAAAVAGPVPAALGRRARPASACRG